jgi:hypothetical protein
MKKKERRFKDGPSICREFTKLELEFKHKKGEFTTNRRASLKDVKIA